MMMKKLKNKNSFGWGVLAVLGIIMVLILILDWLFSWAYIKQPVGNMSIGLFSLLIIVIVSLFSR